MYYKKKGIKFLFKVIILGPIIIISLLSILGGDCDKEPPTVCCPVSFDPTSQNTEKFHFKVYHDVICHCAPVVPIEYTVLFGAYTLKDGKAVKAIKLCDAMVKANLEAIYPPGHANAGQVFKNFNLVSKWNQAAQGIFNNPKEYPVTSPQYQKLTVTEDAVIRLTALGENINICVPLQKEERIFVIGPNGGSYKLCVPLGDITPQDLFWELSYASNFANQIIVEKVQNLNPFSIKVYVDFLNDILMPYQHENDTSDLFKGKNAATKWKIQINDPQKEKEIRDILNDPTHPDHEKYKKLCIKVYLTCKC